MVELPAKHYACGTISLLTSVNDADTPQATAVEASTEQQIETAELSTFIYFGTYEKKLVEHQHEHMLKKSINVWIKEKRATCHASCF